MTRSKNSCEPIGWFAQAPSRAPGLQDHPAGWGPRAITPLWTQHTGGRDNQASPWKACTLFDTANRVSNAMRETERHGGVPWMKAEIGVETPWIEVRETTRDRHPRSGVHGSNEVCGRAMHPCSVRLDHASGRHDDRDSLEIRIHRSFEDGDPDSVVAAPNREQGARQLLGERACLVW